MQQIGQAATAVARQDAASELVRLHALALSAARDRDGLPVAFDRDVDQEIPRAVLTAWKPDGNARPLRRPLTVGEHGAVEARAAALDLALKPYGEDQQATVEMNLGAMFNGFRAMRQQDEDVDATLAIAAGVLRDFPAWAVERACLKIARHEVGLDARYAPNDGQIADVVRELLRPYRQAFEQASGLLSGSVEAEAAIPPPRSQRPSYDELVARCRADGLGIGSKGDAEERVRRQEAEAPAVEQKMNAARVAEYVRAGLAPPEPKDGIVVSLPMMLKMGFRIEEIGGEKVLVSPRKQEAEA